MANRRNMYIKWPHKKQDNNSQKPFSYFISRSHLPLVTRTWILQEQKKKNDQTTFPPNENVHMTSFKLTNISQNQLLTRIKDETSGQFLTWIRCLKSRWRNTRKYLSMSKFTKYFNICGFILCPRQNILTFKTRLHALGFNIIQKN